MSKRATKRKAKAAAPTTPKQGDTVLILRVCNADMTSSHGFTWPESGHVEAADWKKTTECGNGLHGWLWGAGDHSVATWTGSNKWLVVEVLASEVIDLKGKVKFPRGEVVYCGDQPGATGYIRERMPKEMAGGQIIGGTASAGDLGTASAGYLGTASAGDRGTASAGDLGTASAGYRGTASAGDRGTASAGDRGTASAGYLGTASAGYRGTASAGDRGTASAGDRGTASAGDRGTASAGEDGAITVRYYDGKRWRIAIGYVGENGIEKGKLYHVENGKFVEGEDAETKAAREEAAKISKMKPVDRPC